MWLIYSLLFLIIIFLVGGIVVSLRVKSGLEGLSLEPIDAVITYVDSSVPEWQSSRRAAETDWNASVNCRDSRVGNRFRSLGELRYCLRAIERYAPWIRYINLIVSHNSQVPDWLLRDRDYIRVVTHDAFMPAHTLPTFNSHAIEANLHRVPGLSKKWIYFNDDVMLARPVNPNDFFDGDKLIIMPDGGIDEHLAPKGPTTIRDTGHNAMWKNVNRLLDKRFTDEPRQRMCHSPQAMNNDVINAIWKAIPEELARTSEQKFRSVHDLGMTCALLPYWAYYTNQALKAPSTANISIIIDISANADANKAAFRHVQRILAQDQQALLCYCINDSDPSVSDSAQKQTKEFLEQMLPEKATFEH